MPSPSRQTIPFGDRPWTEPSRNLTFAAYQFLARLTEGVSTTIKNVEVIGQAVGVPVETIPSDGGTVPLLPAAFPPAPVGPGGLSDAIAEALAMARLAAPSRPARDRGDMLALLPPAPALARQTIPEPRQHHTGVVTLLNGARVLDGFGMPAGRVAGWIGDLYLQRDGGTSGALWSKQTGAGTDTGWVTGNGGTPSAGILPLVNGDISPVGLMTDPSGQTIGVPL